MAQNDDTIFQAQDVNGIETTETTETAKKAKKQWKRVTIGSIGAILVGAGAAYAANMQDEAMADLGQEFPSAGSSPDTAHAVKKMELPDETLMAETVTDDMTFSEAFKTARKEVGTAGVFKWKDGTFSTFTQEEWDGLSDADKNLYAQRVGEIANSQEDEDVNMNEDLDDAVLAELDDADLADSDDVDILDDDVRFLGEDPDGDLAEDAVVEIDEEGIVDVDLTEDEAMADLLPDEVPLEDFASEATDVADIDDATEYVQGLVDDSTDNLTASVSDDVSAI